MDLNFAKDLAGFLQTDGVYAFCSLALIGYAIKDRQLRKSEQEKFELALEIAPLADRLGTMLENAAKAAARGRRLREGPSSHHHPSGDDS